MMRLFARTAVMLGAVLLASCTPRASGPATEGVTDAMLVNPPEGEWLSYGRDPSEQRFSRLKVINDGNVGQLGLAWAAEMETARGQEATPLMHDGTLYVTTAWSILKAYDAKTGRLKWSYDPKVPRDTLVRACCDAVNRGVALYGTSVYLATLDGRLISLKQSNGALMWSALVVPNQQDYTITGAPRIANGLVLIGSGGAEYKARGFLAAYDHRTGEQVWRFHTVPGNPADGQESAALEKAEKTWAGKWWELGGGGTVWDSITYDAKTGLVLFGTGNAEPWNPAAAGRQGDSLYTSSVVAVRADTGEYVWHFQETPEDRWDYDSNAQITLADIEIGGKLRHVALHAPKNGYFYVLDAATGEFLSAGAFSPQNWTTGIDAKTGRPVINPEARYEKTGKPFIGMPGVAGAHSWQPMSYSPATGLVYIPANIAAFPYLAAQGWKPSEIGFQLGLDSAAVAMPAVPQVRAGAMAATTGALLAWDPKTQKAAWSVPHAGPFNGGTLATAGNLVFQGDAAGSFSAYAADKGRKLWSFPVQTGAIAAPMSYAIDGEQYVAILVGWGGLWDQFSGVLAHKSGATRNISRLLVFKLGAKGQLPAPVPLSKLPLDPPAFTGTKEQAALGAGFYARYCTACHGDAAVAGGLNPDLRRSAVLGNPKTMQAIVHDGALSPKGGGNGMVSFKSALKPADIEAIRQYLILRANEDKALGEK
ncbi:PQQ-dependent dehydrogenase, methanol/ethanol family [Novosphingobium aquae]|uniref:PQQ-dependent dehydrogenase, methanol/ethanol family n=1 Tax=Novosphingobium aquae TaxID=3133435 RepID=A0ABU8SD63_9SPHN